MTLKSGIAGVVGLLVLIAGFFLFNSGEEVTTGSGVGVHYEFLNGGDVLHLWNANDDYYFNSTSGVQFTNHHGEYWNKNIFCAGYKTSVWNYWCNDVLPFTWSIYNDSQEVNITGYKDVSVGSKTVRIGLRYHLGTSDANLTVQPFIYGMVGNISNKMGFAWIIKNIDVSANNNTDFLYINDSFYLLNESFNERFTNLNTSQIWYGDDTTGDSLWLSWDENLDYLVDSNENKSMLVVSFNGLNEGQLKTTKMYWLDALCNWYTVLLDPTTYTEVNLNGDFSMDCEITYSGTCLSRGSMEAQLNDSGWTKITSSTSLSTTDANSQNCIGNSGVCGITGWTITADVVGEYQVRCLGAFNRELTKKASGVITINVTTPDYFNCTYTEVSSDTTLTSDSTNCYNFTSNNINFDCDSYDLNGLDQKFDYLFITNGNNNITVKNCDIYDYPQTLFVDGGENFSWVNNTVQDGDVTDTTNATIRGIYLLNAKNWNLENSTMTDTFGNDTSNSQASDSENCAFKFSNVTNSGFNLLTVKNWSGETHVSSEGFILSKSAGYAFCVGESENVSVHNSKINKTGRTTTFSIDANNDILYINNTTFDTTSLSSRFNNTIFSNNNFYNSPGTTLNLCDDLKNGLIDSNNVWSWESGVSSYCIKLEEGENFSATNNYCNDDFIGKGILVKSTGALIQNNVFNNTASTNTDEAVITVEFNIHHTRIINNTITNFNTTGSRAGGIAFGGQNTSIIDNTIMNSINGYGIASLMYDVTTYNNTITNVTDGDFYFGFSAEMTSIGGTFNKSNVKMTGSDDFLVGSYITIHVQDTSGTSVEEANVTLYNVSDVEISNGTTDSGGNITFVVFEYLQTGETTYVTGCTGTSNVVCYTPHNATANKTGGYTLNNTVFTANTTKTVDVVIESSADPCDYVSGDFLIETVCTFIAEIVNVIGDTIIGTNGRIELQDGSNFSTERFNLTSPWCDSNICINKTENSIMNMTS